MRYDLFNLNNQKAEGIQKLQNLGVEINWAVYFMPTSYLLELADAIEEAFTMFPCLKGALTNVYIDKLHHNTFASTGRIDKTNYIIRLNALYWFSPFFRYTLKKGFKTGDSSTSTIKGLVFHEVAHVINGLLISKYSKYPFAVDWNENKLASFVLNKIGFSKDDAILISSYAYTDAGEAFAETMAAVMTNEIFSSAFEPAIRQKAYSLFTFVQKYL